MGVDVLKKGQDVCALIDCLVLFRRLAHNKKIALVVSLMDILFAFPQRFPTRKLAYKKLLSLHSTLDQAKNNVSYVESSEETRTPSMPNNQFQDHVKHTFCYHIISICNLLFEQEMVRNRIYNLYETSESIFY